jgi:hypothetical protein
MESYSDHSWIPEFKAKYGLVQDTAGLFVFGENEKNLKSLFGLKRFSFETYVATFPI